MFGHYTKQAPQQGRTVPYVLYGLRNADGTSPIVHVEHIGESNRPFWLDALAKASAKAKEGAAAPTTPTEIDRMRRANREDNRETVIAHSARRLERVFRQDGTPATDKDLRAFILAIPDSDFDELWAFVQNPHNFRDFTIAEEPEKLAGE